MSKKKADDELTRSTGFSVCVFTRPSVWMLMIFSECLTLVRAAEDMPEAGKFNGMNSLLFASFIQTKGWPSDLYSTLGSRRLFSPSTFSTAARFYSMRARIADVCDARGSLSARPRASSDTIKSRSYFQHASVPPFISFGLPRMRAWLHP